MTGAGYDEYRWTSDDGLALCARDYAGGSDKLPVICIPGLTRNCRDFEAVAPWIAGLGRRVLAVDLRGRGRSARDPDPRHYKPATYAADVSALLRSLQLPRALFLGTSLGGIVIMTLAARRLPEIGGAILNDVGPRVAAAGLARIAGYAGKGAPVANWDDAAAYARRTNGAAFPHYGDAEWQAFARRTFKEGDNGRPELDYDARVVAPVNRLVMKLMSPLAWAAFRRLARNRQVLLIRGAQSDILDSATAARMKRTAPSMSIAEIPGIGHAPMLDEPVARAAIQAFLDSAP